MLNNSYLYFTKLVYTVNILIKKQKQKQNSFYESDKINKHTIRFIYYFNIFPSKIIQNIMKNIHYAVESQVENNLKHNQLIKKY